MFKGEESPFKSFFENRKPEATVIDPEVTQSVQALKTQAPDSQVTAYVLNLSKDQLKTLDIVLEGIHEEGSDETRITYESFVAVFDPEKQTEVVEQMKTLLSHETSEEQFEIAKKKLAEIVDENSVEPKMFAAI